MKILFLDTSSFFINIAIVTEKEIIHHQEANSHKLSENIFNIISDFFEKNELKLSDITKIYVTTGPGSFTGIRIGLTIAKTMAWDLKIPICDISTLLLYASNYKEEVIVCIPEKDEMGYIGLYNKNLTKKEEKYTNINNYLKEKTEKIITLEKNNNIDFRRIIKKYEKKAVEVHTIKPNYLKKLAVEK